ncbi:uncharacterized protein [Venturia canescens]|uniref:uncharacterized protein n=1 Tax=Venturia canescens TaxID=32260 RepID=UPI001C9CBE75|nr:uncharacterized protein LOC122412253 [Venturia canescens]
MERRNYFAIMLLVFGVIGVYSHSQRSDAGHVLPSVESVQDSSDEGLADFSVLHANKDAGGRSRRDKPPSEKKKVEQVAKAARNFVFRQPQTLSSAELAHQIDMRELLGYVDINTRTGMNTDMAIDRAIAQHTQLVRRIKQYIRAHPSQ